VQGYAPEFRLAAYAYGRLYLYQAAINHQARTGADLLDIAGKVRFIGIEQVETQHSTVERTGGIADQARLTELVNMVRNAPVVGNTTRHNSKFPPLYQITFYLKDGTEVKYFYWPDNSKANHASVPPIAASGLLLPKEFQAVIEKSLQH
jgi:hypothetical protein